VATSEEDLTAIADAIRDGIEERDLVLFPDFPLIDDDEGGGLGHALWMDDDWAAFLDVAQRAGARLIYLRVDETDEGILADFEDAAEGDTEAAVALQQAVRRAHKHLGSTFGIRVGFACDGILHDWTCTADWYDELLELSADTQRDRTDGNWPRPFERTRTPEEQEILDHTEEWAETVSEDRRFIEATNEAGRREAAGIIVPELGEHLASTNTGDRGYTLGLSLDVLRQAELRLKSVVKPRIETAAEAELDQWAGELAADSRYRLAGTKDERRRLVAALIADKCGYRVPRLVEPLLRRTDET